MKIIAMIAICTLLLNACGSIIRGSRQEIQFTSNESEVEIWVDGFKISTISEYATISEYTSFEDSFTEKGRTKIERKTNYARIKLDRGDKHIIEFRKKGFDKQTIRVSKSITVGYVIVDLLIGVLPLLIDVATGAIYELEPDTTHIVLTSNEE